MRFVRFKSKNGDTHFGLVREKRALRVLGDIFSEYETTDIEYDLNEVTLLPPCVPTKIVAVGLNYREHAKEMRKKIPEEPLLFLKPSTSIIGHEDRIVYPGHMSSRVDYEGELAVVIGKKARWVKESAALDHVFGYTCMNDVTARDLQAMDVQYTRAKGFDTFAPIGPMVETELDPSDLRIATYLNMERKQYSTTRNLIFSVPRLISFISQVMTLLPGDIIATGTPAGIGSMKSGDRVEVDVEGIGVLRNYVE